MKKKGGPDESFQNNSFWHISIPSYCLFAKENLKLMEERVKVEEY